MARQLGGVSIIAMTSSRSQCGAKLDFSSCTFLRDDVIVDEMAQLMSYKTLPLHDVVDQSSLITNTITERTN